VRTTAVFFLCAAAAACGGSSTSPTTTAALSAVTLSTPTASGGSIVTGTITLTAAAPSAGAVVTLASSNASLATVPASVTIASGSTSGTFDVQTGTTSVTGLVTITAAYAGASTSTALTVGRATIQSFALSPSSTIGGGSVAATVTVSAPAPDSGLDVAITSSNPAAIVPPHATIPAGQTSQTFTVGTKDTASPVMATITATLSFTGSTRDATLSIARLGVQQVALGLAALPGGLPVTGTVVLTAPAPVDVQVLLSSSDAAATVPAAVTVPAGVTSQPFDIATVDAPPTRTVTITATYGGTTQSAALTVIAYATIPSISCASTTPKAGTAVACTGALSAPAPAGGWQLAITSSDDSVAGSVPNALTVPAGATSFSFTIVTAPVTSTMPVVIQILDAPSGLVLFSQAFTITP